MHVAGLLYYNDMDNDMDGPNRATTMGQKTSVEINSHVSTPVRLHSNLTQLCT